MNETLADDPDQPMMSLHRLAKLQGMDEDKLRARMEAYDKPSPKGTGMQLAYNGPVDLGPGRGIRPVRKNRNRQTK